MNMKVDNLKVNQDNKETVSQDKVVRLRFHITDASSGQLVQYGDDLVFLHGGYGGAFPKVERAIEGCRVGDQVNVDLLPEEGYGHRQSELRIDVGVLLAELGDLPPGRLRVGSARQGAAVREGREGVLQRDDLEAVPGQIQLTDDVRPEQAHDVGVDREREAGKYLLARRGAPENGTALQNEHLPSRLGEIGGACQAVVAAADDDGIVRGACRFVVGWSHSGPLSLRIEERCLHDGGRDVAPLILHRHLHAHLRPRLAMGRP